MKDTFRKAANKVSNWTGSALAFLLAFTIIIVWAASGPSFHFSGTWQLVINTGTTIVTFLMVFLIQNTQNRDGKAMQLKLDELIRSSENARTSFVDLEDLTDQDLANLDDEFRKIHEIEADKLNPVLHKLHVKIKAEHKRRLTVKGTGEAFSNFIHKND
jgi:low affinity Fe/Cu permease